MNTSRLIPLALLAFAFAPAPTALHAQTGDLDLPTPIAAVTPISVESARCTVDASPARVLLDRAARLDRDAALVFLERVRDSLEAVVGESDAEGQFALAAVRGTEATLEGGKSQVRAAEAAFRHSRRVLELEPGHPGAAYVLGRLNAGVMRTSRLTRWLASRLMGGDALGDASWEEAQRLLEMAVEASPCDPEYRYELGRVYADRGRIDEAIHHLDAAVKSPERGPRARVARDEARALRERLWIEATAG